MLDNYINIPLKINAFKTESKPIGTVKLNYHHHVLACRDSLTASIKQYLDLLFLSQEGEAMFDKDFGLEVWDHNFESKKLNHEERKEIEREIYNDLNKYEPRLIKDSHNVEVTFKNESKLLNGERVRMHILEVQIRSVLNEKFKSKVSQFEHIFSVPVKVYFNI